MHTLIAIDDRKPRDLQHLQGGNTILGNLIAALHSPFHALWLGHADSPVSSTIGSMCTSRSPKIDRGSRTPSGPPNRGGLRRD